MSEHDTPIPETEPSPEELAALEEAFEREFGANFSAAHDDAAAAMEPGRVDVLARVRQRLDEDAAGARRRERRRHLRVLFYVVNLCAIFLIFMIYVGTRAAIRLKEVEGRKLATQTEVVALSRALVRHLAQNRSAPLPEDFPALVRALQGDEQRPEDYPFDEKRLRDGGYLDDFGRPYRLRVERSQVLIYSVGPNGEDDEGKGDDIRDEWVHFVR